MSDKNEKKVRLTFTKATQPFVLEALGYEVDSEGYITKDGELVLDVYHQKHIRQEEIGGFDQKGIIRDDLHSMMSYVDDNNITG